MALSEATVKNARPKPKAYKLSDELGMFLPGQSQWQPTLAPEIPLWREREASRTRRLSRSQPKTGEGNIATQPGSF
jgi:hypothetical protein